MPVFASVALLTGWALGSTCPVAFSSTSTTIGAITNSSALNLCVSKSQLISGSRGSVTLVIGGSNVSAAQCLVYPIGLSADLAYQLIASGHVGCWSLYPPGQSVTIVNIGIPTSARIQTALKQFRPDLQRILVSPKEPYSISNRISFSSTAITKQIKSTLLNLPLVIRFTPNSYYWQLAPAGDIYRNAKPIFIPKNVGSVKANLRVGYSVNYSFTNLTPWRKVTPDIYLNSQPMTLTIGALGELPESDTAVPRLVGGPCLDGSTAWGC